VSDESPEQQLEEFISRYTPEIGRLARAVLARMAKRLPGAVQLVYDNYNALVIGFGPTERASEAVFSIALYPRWINLFFLQRAELPDPQGLLLGSGNQVRHLVLRAATDLDRPEVRQLMEITLAQATRPIDRKQPGRMVIKSISAKQRPRRPS
jgi:hypothetical protein